MSAEEIALIQQRRDQQAARRAAADKAKTKNKSGDATPFHPSSHPSSRPSSRPASRPASRPVSGPAATSASVDVSASAPVSATASAKDDDAAPGEFVPDQSAIRKKRRRRKRRRQDANPAATDAPNSEAAATAPLSCAPPAAQDDPSGHTDISVRVRDHGHDRVRRERRERLVEERAKRVPDAFNYPDELPVSLHRDEIAALIRDHQVVIVAGATGSGKTTQLPKIALELGRGRAGQIGVTQPRRLAATSVAARLAQELDSPLGHAVGYQIRFDGRLDPATPVKFMTDGILLAEIRRDRDLARYDTLILDEAHERGLNTDFLLGYLRRLLPRRPDLRVVVSSATLAVERFREFFGGAPAIEVEGRVYPIETRYRPPEAYGQPANDDNEADDPDIPALVRAARDELAREGPEGDILVFLAGEADIRATAEALEADNPGRDLVLPLFARLPWEQQRRVFAPAPSGRRKIVLATNVAETSLTIPGVRAVVDTGLARVRRASERSSVERLRIEPVSRASADQRRGRCGRTGPGVCIRLYSEDNYEARPAHTDPEIRRAGLAGVILQMAGLELGAVDDFPFLDPPKPAAVSEGYRALLEIGALDAERRLTDIGRRLAPMPLEPRLARMLVAAGELGVADEVLAVVAFLAIQDPRERPAEKRGEADAAHRHFAHARSDFVGVLALWDFYQDARAAAPSKSAARRLCRKHFLNYLRMEEWRDIHAQLAGLLRHAPRTRGLFAADWSGKRPRAGDPLADRYAALHQALLTGLLGRIGRRAERGEYAGARGVRFHLWPGGGVTQLARLARAANPHARSKKNPLPVVNAADAAKAAKADDADGAGTKPSGAFPEWVVCAELTETTRLYGRLVAAVEPAWIEKAAGWLAKRGYSAPYYDENTGFVRALERVRVQGLTVVENRPVHYGPINPEQSRAIFIREALVDGRLKTRPAFFAANQKLRDVIETQSHKARRAAFDDAESVRAFYDARLPQDVSHDRALRQWLARDPAHERALSMAPEDLDAPDARGLSPERFPPAVNFEGRRYPLAYRFASGADDDGVTLTLPAADLGALPAWRLEWLVPGWLGEVVACLLRALPKSRRRDFVPIPDAVEAVLPLLGDIKNPDKPLRPALARALGQWSGQPLAEDLLDPSALPAHLRMNLRVTDADGAVLAEGRDLQALRAGLARDADDMFAALAKQRHERENITAWDFGEWPVSVALPGALAFPALVDEGRAAALRLRRTRAEADEHSRGGLMRLFALALAQPLAKTRAGLPLSPRASMLFSADGYSPDALKDDLLAAALAGAFVDGLAPPRTREAFFERIAGRREAFARFAHGAARALDAAARASEDLLSALACPPSPGLAEVYASMSAEARFLLSRRSVVDATPEQLSELPRYFQAMEKRRERLGWALAKDRARRAEFEPWMARWREADARRRGGDGGGSHSSRWALRDYRWLLEDWRVVLFAPELSGGRGGVTRARVEAAWRAAEKAAEGAKEGGGGKSG